MTRDQFIYALTACGCLLKDGKTWYEHNELIKCFEDLGLFEQEPILDRNCEHCSKTYGTLGCCTTVSNKWVYSCKEGQREYLLNKIRAEIEQEIIPRNSDQYDHEAMWQNLGLRMALKVIDKYKAESEDKECI